MKEELPLNKGHFFIGDNVFYTREANDVDYERMYFCTEIEIKSIVRERELTREGPIFLRGFREGVTDFPIERCFKTEGDALKLAIAELRKNISESYIRLERFYKLEDSMMKGEPIHRGF